MSAAALLQAGELLQDSEASLRLVDSALAEIRGPAAADGEERPAALAVLPSVLLRAYGEINSALAALRQSRGVLEQTALEKLAITNEKLREVSSATEVAATGILDGLDRAVAMIDDLDAAADSGDAEKGAELRGVMRDELFGLMGHLQFQDITTQQLSYASSILVEMENRLVQLARLFDPSVFGLEFPTNGSAEGTTRTFDPAATTQNAEERQAIADEIFTS